MATKTLTTSDHSRDSAGMTYVYPVISRRAGGLSIGINLNPNNACNWQCIYCQVPNLRRGAAPSIDHALLQDELRHFLNDVLEGDFYERFQVAPPQRTLCDIAISGNGEATSADNFDDIVRLIGQIADEFNLLGKIKLVLITNGSLARRMTVQNGVRQIAALGGEVWFKLDSATDSGVQSINSAQISVQRIRENLATMAECCPTWIQTCVFELDGLPPSDEEQQAYLGFLAQTLTDTVPLRGVLLYGLARTPMQPEALRLVSVSETWLEHYADKIRGLGFAVKALP